MRCKLPYSFLSYYCLRVWCSFLRSDVTFEKDWAWMNRRRWWLTPNPSGADSQSSSALSLSNKWYTYSQATSFLSFLFFFLHRFLFITRGRRRRRRLRGEKGKSRLSRSWTPFVSFRSGRDGKKVLYCLSRGRTSRERSGRWSGLL